MKKSLRIIFALSILAIAQPMHAIFGFGSSKQWGRVEVYKALMNLNDNGTSLKRLVEAIKQFGNPEDKDLAAVRMLLEKTASTLDTTAGTGTSGYSKSTMQTETAQRAAVMLAKTLDLPFIENLELRNRDNQVFKVKDLIIAVLEKKF